MIEGKHTPPLVKSYQSFKISVEQLFKVGLTLHQVVELVNATHTELLILQSAYPAGPLSVNPDRRKGEGSEPVV